MLSGLAFKGGPAGRAELLLYLALCDHADVQGRCYPGLARLAQWTRQNEKNVRRVLLKLKGWVKITPVGRGQEYQIDIPKLCRSALASAIKLTEDEQKFVRPFIADKKSTVDKMSGVSDGATVDISDPPLRTFPTATVDISDPCIENRQEPSLEPIAPTLHVVAGVTGTKKKTPSRPSCRVNPLHTPVKELLKASLARVNIVPGWGDAPDVSLGRLLKKLPDQPLEFFERCIQNLERSAAKYHTKDLRVIIAALPEFQIGAKDTYGNVIVARAPVKDRPGLPSQMEIERDKAIAAAQRKSA